jgi:hypothetical protein
VAPEQSALDRHEHRVAAAQVVVHLVELAEPLSVGVEHLLAQPILDPLHIRHAQNLHAGQGY